LGGLIGSLWLEDSGGFLLNIFSCWGFLLDLFLGFSSGGLGIFSSGITGGLSSGGILSWLS